MANSLNKITTKSILDATVATADIADDAVTADKLANAINTDIAAKAVLTGSTNNQITTVTGANAIQGEANLNFDGSQLGVGSSANYGTIGTAAAFQVQGTNTGGNASMNIVNAATSNASSTCDINAWQDYRLATRIISGRENANNWTSASSQAASYLGFYTNSAGTVAERVRIRSAGGITFNGDTAAANALDDYEEGTFTPYMRGTGGSVGTYAQSNLSGTYTKIGNLVYFSLQAVLTDKGSYSGNFKWGGLPFTARSGDSYAVSMDMYPSTNVDAAMRAARVNGGDTFGYVMSGSRLDIPAPYSEIVTSYYLRVSGCYQAA